jgi:flagellar export protein FliJ
MKRFEFRLAKVRDFRCQQLDLEEAALEKLHSELRALDAEVSRLDKESERTRASLMVTTSVEAGELVAADRYLRHMAAARKRQAEKAVDCQGRIRTRLAAVVEARRHVRLMEKLEEQQRCDWTAEADREQENLSSELYLARWKNP